MWGKVKIEDMKFPMPLQAVSSIQVQTKQDYILHRLENRSVVVQGNPRVFKALRGELGAVAAELRRIEAGAGVDDDGL